jgi:hypothetical protein
MVEVATGWVACAGLCDKRQETVFHALQRLEAECHVSSNSPINVQRIPHSWWR